MLNKRNFFTSNCNNFASISLVSLLNQKLVAHPSGKYPLLSGRSVWGQTQSPWLRDKANSGIGLKVHKREKFFGSDFQLFTIS